MATIKPVQVAKTKYGTYSLHFTSPDGRRRRLSVGSNEQQAQRTAIKFADWLLDGKDPECEMERAKKEESAKSITLKEFYPRFMEEYGKRQSEGQQANYSAMFRNLCRCPELAECPIGRLKKGMVKEYLNLRRDNDGVAASTANHDLNFINSMLNRAVESEILDRNPIAGLKRFKTPDKRDVVLTPDQGTALFNELPPRLVDVCEFAVYTGFRLSNILGLRIEKIRLHDLTETGEVDMVIKGGRLETFALSAPALKVLKRRIGDRQEGFVFVNPKTGQNYRRSGINAFYRTVRKLGLTAKDGSPLRFHDLRHVFATRVTDLGVSLDQLRLLLGHRDRSTTDRYVTYDRRAVGEQLSALQPLGK